MIISKQNFNYITRSDKPNENWIGEDYYLVDDNSQLAKRIIEFYPRCDYVIDGDNIVDVKYIEKTEKEIKEERAEEIHNELNELDKTINRATEDLYELTETTPYASTQEVINRKKELRQELREVVDNV